MKFYSIWYEYRNKNIYPNLPYEKVKKTFENLWKKYQYDPDKKAFKFFQIKCENGETIVFNPSTCIVVGLEGLSDSEDTERFNDLFFMRKNK